MDPSSTTYLISLRPYLEVLSVTEPGGPAASRSVLPLGGPGDVTTATASASAELLHLLRRLQVARSGRVVSSLLMLLTAGGVCCYLIYRRPDVGEEAEQQQSRWRPRGWLWWIFGDEDVSGDLARDSLALRGSYFGPSATMSSPERLAGFASTRGSAEDILRRMEESSSAPCQDAASPLCPNCRRCACRTTTLVASTPKDRTASSSSTFLLPANSHLLPPTTSTPEMADDEFSDSESAVSPNHHSSNCCQCQSRASEASSSLRRSRAKGDGADSSVASSSSSFAVHPPPHHQPAPRVPKKHRARTAQLYNAARHQHHHRHRRLPPLGEERWSASPVLPAGRCDDPGCRDPHCLAAPSAVIHEESTDSIASVSGSMVDLVRGAREVRRLIREASLDSLASDLSLDLRSSMAREDLGASTEHHLDSLQGRLREVRDDCGAITERVDVMNAPANSTMTSSKSDFSVASGAHVGTPAANLKEGSIPDLRTLQKPKVHFWKINDIVAESATSSLLSSPLNSGSYNGRGESLEWESPEHGWHDLRKSKYKLALGGSELGDEATEDGGDDDEDRRSVLSHLTHGSDAWEWDCEGLTSSPQQQLLLEHRYQVQAPASMLHHQKWLPESAERIELDLETELASASSCASSLTGNRSVGVHHYFHQHYYGHKHHVGGGGSRSAGNSRSSSRRSSFDRTCAPNPYAFRVRQPPSGRSSVERGSGDTPRDAIDHADLVRSFAVYSQKEAAASSSSRRHQQDQQHQQQQQVMVSSYSSEESGFQDGAGGCLTAPSSQETSCSSSAFVTSGLTLSPVHEAREPGGGGSSASATPVRKSRSFSAADGKRKRLFREEETLHVVINRE